jgi:hypothetical protein
MMRIYTVRASVCICFDQKRQLRKQKKVILLILKCYFFRNKNKQFYNEIKSKYSSVETNLNYDFPGGLAHHFHITGLAKI